MKKGIIFIIIFLSLNLVYGLSGEEILIKSDSAFIPEMATMKMRMELYNNNSYIRYYEFSCFLKGNNKYLLIFKDPPIVRKRAQLRVNDVIWNYLGKINKTTKISARAMFLNSVFTQEDIMNTTLNYLYRVDKVETVKYKSIKYYKLSLISRNNNSAYYRIETFINAKNFLPLKRDYYSYSNNKIKEMEIKSIKRESGKTKSVSLIVYDTLRPGRYTKVIFYNINKDVNLPDRMFTKKYMELAIE